jgi:hypothetical protein
MTPKVCFYPATNSDSVSTNSRIRSNQRRGNCASSTSSRSPVGAVKAAEPIDHPTVPAPLTLAMIVGPRAGELVANFSRNLREGRV